VGYNTCTQSHRLNRTTTVDKLGSNNLVTGSSGSIVTDGFDQSMPVECGLYGFSGQHATLRSFRRHVHVIDRSVRCSKAFGCSCR